jgi:hypothetical protein
MYIAAAASSWGATHAPSLKGQQEGLFGHVLLVEIARSCCRCSDLLKKRSLDADLVPADLDRGRLREGIHTALLM